MIITIKKIAEIAKVSRGTVDKVLNNRVGVSDEVRKRVRDIIDSFNYHPNKIGKALSQNNKLLTIGVILAPDYNSFVDGVKKGVEAARKKFYDFGVRIEIHVLKRLDAEEEYGIMKSMMENNISALSLVPIQDKLITDCINKMHVKGIPVITFNSDIYNSKRLCFVGQDHYMGGRVAADLMGKTIGGSGNIVVITSSQNLLCHVQRLEGFRTKLKENYTNINIIDVFENEDEELKAFNCVMSLIDKSIDLKGIYITGGGVSGVSKALKIAHKEKIVKIISHDFAPETINLMKEGIIDFTIGQDPFSQGYLPIEMLYEYLFSKSIPKIEFVKTKIDIRVEENIDLI